MKKKVLSLFLSVTMVLLLAASLSCITTFADDGDYIEIRTIEDLYNVRNDLTANYKLMNDIDLSETSDPDSIYNYYGMGWNPIGNPDDYCSKDYALYQDGFFTGCFDGNGHTISNLYINYEKTVSVAGRYNIGLFFVNNGTIKNLHIRNSNISASISSNSSSVYPQLMVGSIAGYNYKQGIITRCSFNGTISGTNSYQNKDAPTGGICGGNMNTITECYNMGSITSSLQASGIFSHTDNASSSAVNCYNIGTIKSTYGTNRESQITPYTKKYSYYVKTSGDTITGGYYDSSQTLTELTESQLMKQMYFPGCDFDNIWKFETATDYKFPQLRNNMMDTAKHVDVIEWKSQPSKIDYYTDEDIDPTGGVLTAYYIDDTHEDIEVTKEMLSGYNMSQLGMQTVTVTFREGTLTYDILTSTRPEIRDMVLESMPDRTEFVRGTSFDFTGASARVNYVNGNSDVIPITAEETTGGDITRSGTYTITFEKFGRSVTFEVKVVPVKATGIIIATPPNKTSYIEGQTLDTTGLIVKLEYNNGKTETITDYTIEEYETTVGTRNITVTYEDFSASFSVEFVPKTLTSIMVTTQPSKAKYVVGEAFDPTGMVVKAVYDNGVSEEVTDYTVSELTDATGWQTLSVSYGGKTTTIKVMVEAREVVSIFISQLPNKTTYIEEEPFDTTGLVVMANYNNVLNEEVTDYTISGATTNRVGEKTVTVLYEGKTATFTINVVEKTLLKIEVVLPEKTEYIRGEEFDSAGMVVKAVYDNGKSETVTGYSVSGFGDTEEENVVTIEYGGKTSAFIVTIHTPETEWTVTQSPACTTGGSQELHCADCGKVLKTEGLDALGHNWSAWEIVDAPNCTDKGSQKHVCGRCGIEEFKDVDPNGHTWVEEYVVDVAPTCTSEGSESWHCSECGVSDPTHTRTIDRLPHNLGDWTTTKDPTCAVSGVRQRVCADCDYLETEEIPATGNHTFGNWTTIKEPTCTEMGSKDRECSVCHLVETEAIVAAGHDWNTAPTIDKAATCTEAGKESTHCVKCNAVKDGSEKTIPATGHKFGSWTITKKATEVSTGQQTHKCSACGKTETKEIAQLAPTLPAVKITTPKAAKKSATIKWKKVSKKNQKKIAKIQIQYSTDRTFKTGVKTVTAKKSAASKKITKLTSKKTYYVRIRAYKKSGGVEHVSKWSAVKSVKAK